MRWSVLIGALIALTGNAAAALDPGTVPEGPQWIRKPAGADLVKYYPQKAGSAGGWAVLSCRVDSEDAPPRCEVAVEAPEGMGFGEASLNASSFFRLKPSATGDKVQVPLAWNSVSGEPLPPRTYIPGEPSTLVTRAPPGLRNGPGVVACPSKSEPERFCQARRLVWAKRPAAKEISDLIHKADGGMSIMECSVGEAGELQKCLVSSDGAGLEADDYLKLAEPFQAPAETTDSTPTAGERVLLSFDWSVLGRVPVGDRGTLNPRLVDGGEGGGGGG